MKSIQKNGTVKQKSDIVKLNPFFDVRGLLRVKGRIGHADIGYDEKFPIIVPAHSHFSRLLMLEAHEKTKHGDVQAMLHYTRAKYWIIRSKRAALKVIKSCGICVRYTKHDKQQLMGELPKERLTVAPPFTYCGVDYFGPIQLKRFEGRCNTIVQ